MRILSAAALIALSCTALDMRLRTVSYAVHSSVLTAPIRLAVIADLHSCRYGKDMKHLIQAVQDAAPHAILLPGDFYDDEHPGDNARIFAAAYDRDCGLPTVAAHVFATMRKTIE